jgi:hypothetical protein
MASNAKVQPYMKMSKIKSILYSIKTSVGISISVFECLFVRVILFVPKVLFWDAVWECGGRPCIAP